MVPQVVDIAGATQGGSDVDQGRLPTLYYGCGIGQLCQWCRGSFFVGRENAQRCSFGKIFALRAERSELWSEVVSKIPNHNGERFGALRVERNNWVNE